MTDSTASLFKKKAWLEKKLEEHLEQVRVIRSELEAVGEELRIEYAKEANIKKEGVDIECQKQSATADPIP